MPDDPQHQSTLRAVLLEQGERAADCALRNGMGAFRGVRASGTAVGANGQRLSWSIVVTAGE